MDRLMPIAVAFALGAVAASVAQMPFGGQAVAGDTPALFEPFGGAQRYPLPGYALGLAAFRN